MSETKTVVIVARTRMYGGRICVGAMSDEGENLRLMNKSCMSDYDLNSPYQIGEQWHLTFSQCGPQKPPHLEDVAVIEAKKVGLEKNLVSYIKDRVKPWEGGVDVLFEGKIQFTRNGAGYISASAIPAGATGFWIPSSDLTLGTDDRGHIGYYPKSDYRHLSYVGTQAPIEAIGKTHLVRVSLARWWKPQDSDPDFEERCYAQLSGWY